MLDWWFRDPRDCGLLLGAILTLIHGIVHITMTLPIIFLYLSILIALLPVRVIEGWIQSQFGVRWEHLPIFHIITKCARFFVFLLGIRVELSGTQELEKKLTLPIPKKSPTKDAPKESVNNEGSDNKDTEWGGCVMVFNHYSFLDGILLTAYCPLAHSYVAKAELLWYPFINIGMWVMGHFFVDRSNRQQATEALHQAADLLIKRNRCIAISPEGTRSHDGRLGGFKKGPFYLASAASVPILPCAILGAFRCWPRQSWIPKPGHVRIVFGSMIPAPTQSQLPTDIPKPIIEKFAPGKLTTMVVAAVGQAAGGDGRVVEEMANILQRLPEKLIQSLIRDYWAMIVWDALRRILQETHPEGLLNRPSWSDHEHAGENHEQKKHNQEGAGTGTGAGSQHGPVKSPASLHPNGHLENGFHLPNQIP